MSKRYFCEYGRDTCEVCGCASSSQVVVRAFAHPSVRGFLENYYENRIPVELLAERPFELRQCPHCDFMWQRFVLNDSAMLSLYEDWISRDASLEKKRTATADFYAEYARQLCGVSVLLNKKPHDISVLDFAMGWGYYCLMAKAFGYRPYGCEFSPARIEYANKQGVDTITFDSINGLRFDFINSEQTFEHVTSPLTVLQNLAASLSTRGVIRIAVPDSGPQRRTLRSPNWQAAKNAFHPLEHINCFNRKSLIELARRAGLEPIVGHDLPVPEYLIARAYKLLGSRLWTVRHFGWKVLSTGPTAVYFRRIA